MEQERLVVAGTTRSIDRCRECHGVFLEFFDGEPSALARALAREADTEVGEILAISEAPLHCPDCQHEMVMRRYLDHGPLITRCETCLATFLNTQQCDQIARLNLPPVESEEPTFFDRVRLWLQALYAPTRKDD